MKVGTWYLWTTVRPTCVVEAWAHFSLFWRQTRAARTQSPRVLQLHTDVWKLTRDTSFNHYWSPWAPWPRKSPGQYKPGPPSLFCFFTQLSERRSVAVQLTFSLFSILLLLNSPRGANLSFYSTSMEERCSLQLTSPGKPPPNPSSKMQTSVSFLFHSFLCIFACDLPWISGLLMR